MVTLPPGMELPDDLTADETRVMDDARKGHATIFDLPENIEDSTAWATVRAIVLVGLLLHHERPSRPKASACNTPTSQAVLISRTPALLPLSSSKTVFFLRELSSRT